jgi:hypothetical protein
MKGVRVQLQVQEDVLVGLLSRMGTETGQSDKALSTQ